MIPAYNLLLAVLLGAKIIFTGSSEEEVMEQYKRAQEVYKNLIEVLRN
jgi:hypothetical protein